MLSGPLYFLNVRGSNDGPGISEPYRVAITFNVPIARQGCRQSI